MCGLILAIILIFISIQMYCLIPKRIGHESVKKRGLLRQDVPMPPWFAHGSSFPALHIKYDFKIFSIPGKVREPRRRGGNQICHNQPCMALSENHFF
jgi:hypothetical protein